MPAFGLTITPKLKLNAAERKVSLSAIEKSCMRGNCLMIMSMHIMLEPKIHASRSQRVLADRATMFPYRCRSHRS